MSVRRRRWRDPATGTVKEVWMVDIEFKRPDGTQTPRVRQVSPVQTKRGAEQFEHQLRQSLLDGTYGKKQKEVKYNGPINSDSMVQSKYYAKHHTQSAPTSTQNQGGH